MTTRIDGHERVPLLTITNEKHGMPSEQRPDDRDETDSIDSVDGTDQPTGTTDRGSSPLLNALLGAVVTVITTPFIPFAPILGGAISGYLDAENPGSGAKIGAISGAVALVPLLVIVPLLLFVLFLDPVFAIGILLVVFFVLLFLVAYTVGLGALGGVLGVYIRREVGN